MAVTSEALWIGCAQLDSLPELTRPEGRVALVSAHPDDEVLGAGGLIAAHARSAGALSFVTVTDGEGSHPEITGPLATRLAMTRTLELVDALTVLGVEQPSITRLGLPDSGVAGHEDRLAEALVAPIADADLVLCPASWDGHPDHAAVGRATLRAANGQVPVLQFPIWMWHWTIPGEQAIPWERACRFQLTPAESRAKEAALACFATQVRPWPDAESGATILPPEVLEHFTRPFEVFFR